MDLVYVCRAGENEELRYSIRSVVANLKHDKIWVVGNKPDWYTGNFIPVKDIGTKFNNVKNCMNIISTHPEISDDFILMNDDFYVLEPMESVPLYHNGRLYTKMKAFNAKAFGSSYTRLITEAYNFLVRRGMADPIDYDIHIPMVMNKEKLQMISDMPGLTRSIYGNVYNIGGEQSYDIKVYNHRDVANFEDKHVLEKRSPYISSIDESFEYLRETMLEEMFPDPSVYEVPLVGIEPTTHRLEV